jgi:hypothetical protein
MRRLLVLSVLLAGGIAGSASAAGSPPSNTNLPSISGTAKDGQILTAHNGAWTNSPTSFAYVWQRCDTQGGSCVAIAGATSKQYTVSSADVGHRVRVAVTASNADGSGAATSQPTGVVASSGEAPTNTRLPSLSGALRQGSTLNVDHGSWSGTRPIRLDYTWQRCDQNGNGCITFIAHNAGARSYTLGVADVGHTMKIEVTAYNSHGTGYVYSRPTGVVGAPTPPATTIAIANVSLPDQLIIDRVSFSPNPVVSRSTPITARFHVSDAKGLSVQGALVFALGLPYGWTYNAPEQPTDATGWATLTLTPTRNMPLGRGHDLVLFVRARKPGENLLAGVSARRLVQEGIG